MRRSRDIPRRRFADRVPEAERKFWADALRSVSANGVLWLIRVLTDRTTDGSLPWPARVSIVSGFFLAIDACKAFVPWTGRVDEAAIEREMRRLQPHRRRLQCLKTRQKSSLATPCDPDSQSVP